jgi:hypothetical protein
MAETASPPTAVCHTPAPWEMDPICREGIDAGQGAEIWGGIPGHGRAVATVYNADAFASVNMDDPVAVAREVAETRGNIGIVVAGPHLLAAVYATNDWRAHWEECGYCNEQGDGGSCPLGIALWHRFTYLMRSPNCWLDWLPPAGM